MQVISEITDHIIVAILITLGGFVFAKRKFAIRNLRMLFYGDKECRVSFGCLLIIKDKDKFLLIRNKNRPESFGPIGGVYKYYATAVPFLDTLSFRAQQTGNEKVNYDLRGYIAINHLNKLISWFDKETDRELESISREFKEELTQDLHLNDQIVTSQTPKCRRLKRMEEGPLLVKTRGYVQYRRLDIFELVSSDAYSQEIVKYLSRKARQHADMAWVTVEEMKRRRTKQNAVISSHSGYLFGEYRIDGEDLPY